MSIKAGSIAVVTGGASGIGSACCHHLANLGAAVVVVDRNITAAQKIASALGSRSWACDVADAASVDGVAQEIDDQVGPVEILVNCAGIIQQPLSPEELPLSVWDDIIAINLRGSYLTSLAYGRRMARRGTGSIVNIASIAASRSMPLHAYAPGKAAIVSMTECLAAEWGRSGVRVNAVSPGYTRTPALQAAIDKGERDVAVLENSALGRMTQPEDVARAVAFLAGQDASAITGINLTVDCGWLLAQTWAPYGGVRPAR